MRVLAGLLLLIAACGAPVAPPLDSTSRPIIDGPVEPGYGSVGALITAVPGRDPSGSFCSGTLIDPKWVLTAAHCLAGASGRVPSGAPESEAYHVAFYMGVDADTHEDGVIAPAVRLFIHPEYGNERTERLYDVALIELAEPVTSTITLPILRETMPNTRGTPLFFVGYGQSNPDGGGGTRRSATFALDSVNTTTFITSQPEGGVCFGDSGGPALLDVDGQWFVAGVNSSVVGDPACYGNSVQVRVDVYASWIDHVMGGGVSCLDDPAACACDGVCTSEGFCDNAQCGAPGCEALRSCVRRCADSLCAIRCLLGAAPEANDLFLELNACIADRCPTNDAACIEAQCRRDLIGCQGGRDAVTGAASCGDTFRCTEACVDHDPVCVDDCFFDATIPSQLDFEAVEACQAARCDGLELGTAEANTCRDTACRASLLTCMPEESCALLGGDCPEGTACVATGWAATYCLPSVGIPIGGTCATGFVVCEDGALCVDGMCREVCSVGADCETHYAPCIPTMGMGAALGVGVCSLVCPDYDGDGACDADDCDPTNPMISPAGTEVCDAAGLDEDCDGERNEGCFLEETPAPPVVEDEGCSCTGARGTGAPSLWIFAALLLLAARRRVVVLLALVIGCSGSEAPTGPLPRDGGPMYPPLVVDAAPPPVASVFTIQQGLIPIGTVVELDDLTVTSPESARGFFVSNGRVGAYSGIWIENLAAGASPVVAVGDVVRVRGEVAEETFSSTVTLATRTRTQIVVSQDSDLVVMGRRAPPMPTMLRAEELHLDEIAELYEGVLVTLGPSVLTDTDRERGEIAVNDLVRLDDLFTTFDFTWLVPGARFASVTGPLQVDERGFVIVPRSDADLPRGPIDPLGCIPTGGFTVCTTRRNFFEAGRHCGAQGGRLPVLATMVDNVAVGELARDWTDRAFWVGCTDLATEGEWLWVDGSTLAYDPWGAGEPNDANGEDCAQNNWRGDGVWNDANCFSRQAYVCEFPGDGAQCTDAAPCAGGRCVRGSCVPP